MKATAETPARSPMGTLLPEKRARYILALWGRQSSWEEPSRGTWREGPSESRSTGAAETNMGRRKEGADVITAPSHFGRSVCDERRRLCRLVTTDIRCHTKPGITAGLSEGEQSWPHLLQMAWRVSLVMNKALAEAIPACFPLQIWAFVSQITEESILSLRYPVHPRSVRGFRGFVFYTLAKKICRYGVPECNYYHFYVR
jgi:hypothetical protein